MNTFKQQCLELRKKDYTLPEIMRVTGRPKTSVYFHIRELPLSVKKQRAIKVANGVRAAQIALSRKGRSTRPFRTFSQWDKDTVHAVAHLLFDGELQSAGCAYHNRSVALVSRVEEAMKAVYDFAPRRGRNVHTGVLRISYYNVELGAYVRKKSEELLRDVVDFPRELKREFLRAFFDDEGCVEFRAKDNQRRVRGYQKDVSVLVLIQKLLCDFSIESRIQSPNEIVVSGKQSLVNFKKEINFSTGVRVNGKRANSTWKKNIEKRAILKKAIESYTV